MKDQKKMPTWLYYGLFLCTLGIIVGLLLMGLNALTKPYIEKQALEKINPKLIEINKNATWKEEKLKNKTVKFYFVGTENEKVYHAFIVSTKGYNAGEINTLVAFDDEGKVCAFQNVSFEKQTKGLGDNALLKHDYQIIGLDALFLSKKQATDQNFSVFSGATISSRAMIQAAIYASIIYLEVKK